MELGFKFQCPPSPGIQEEIETREIPANLRDRDAMVWVGRFVG